MILKRHYVYNVLIL